MGRSYSYFGSLLLRLRGLRRSQLKPDAGLVPCIQAPRFLQGLVLAAFPGVLHGQ